MSVSEISAMIIDDEAISIEIVKSFLAPFSQIKIIGEYTKSSEAVQQVINLKPDLLFMDIQMPVLNGFECIQSFAPYHNPYIVFITAYDQYAIQAFEVNALAYLLKPFDQQKFNHAIRKTLHYFDKISDERLKENMNRLLSMSLKLTSPFLEKIMIKEAKKVFYVPVQDISIFEASGDYIKLIGSQKSYLIHQSLSSLEKELNPAQFVRIHRSTMINIEQVLEFLPYFNGEYHIVMKQGDKVKLSRSYIEKLKAFFPGL